MSKEKKLSEDKLIECLEEAFVLAIEKSILQGHKEELDQAFQQIKSLIESSAQEPSEAEVEELIEKLAYDVCEAVRIHPALTRKTGMSFIRRAFKEYDELGRE